MGFSRPLHHEEEVCGRSPSAETKQHASFIQSYCYNQHRQPGPALGQDIQT